MLKMKKWIATLAILTSASVSGSEQLQLFACDTCSVQTMQHIAELQAPLLQCEGGINPETGVIDVDYWENNANCYAPTKDLLVVNPLQRVAFKYRVRGHNPTSSEPGYVVSLSMNASELEIVQTYYDLYNSFLNSIQMLNDYSTTSSYSTISSAYERSSLSTFNEAETMQLSTNQSVSEDCLNSAAAHLYSSEQNKNRIFNAMRTAIKNEVDKQTWRDFTSSLLTTGIVSTGGLTITAGLSPGVSGALSVSVEQQYIQNTLTVNPVGARNCRFFGLICSPEDENNQIHYRVLYHGNVTTSGISHLQLEFQMLTNISKVEGYSLPTLLSSASLSLTSSPNSCLSQLVNSTSPGQSGFVSAGPLGSPTEYNFGDGPKNYCEQTKIVRTCTNTGSGSTFVCYDNVFTTLTMCPNI